MIHVNGSQHGNQGMNDIGGVQTATETGLKDHEFNALAPEMIKGQRGGNFEKCWMTLRVNEFPYPMDTPDKVCIIDRQTIDLDSLVKPDQMWRGEESGLDSGGARDGVNHRADRSLAVRTCDMDEPQFVLWFSQGRE
jgi:hypothetical protein